MISVVVEVTSLAHRLEVLVAAILGRVIQVSGGEHDNRAGPVCQTAVDVRAPAFMRTAAALSLALATAASPLEANPTAQRLPVGRIARAVFRSDRHC
jgi:hypothetical protein